MFYGFVAGRVVNDAKVFTYNTNNGQRKGVSFSVASNNQNSDEATFVNCTYFNRDENLAQYILQGNQVIVRGNVTLTDDGSGGRYLNMVVDDFEFGAKKQ